MTLEQFLLMIFGIIIVFLLFLVFIMWVRIQQLMHDMETIENRIHDTDSELDVLTRNIEEIKKMKI
jgi:Na+-transporting methylmalonyl-CoA/oxaloacetate decarboxylase gamma subunit